MRILWFANTPSLYEKSNHAYFGGGWIESLERLVSCRPDVELGIAFFHGRDDSKVVRGNTTYYPIKTPRGSQLRLHELRDHLFGGLWDDVYVDRFENITSDFAPDIVQIFGTERSFGRLVHRSGIPIVIHIQGILSQISAAYFPPGDSRSSYLFDIDYLLRNARAGSPAQQASAFARKALRERDILSSTQFVFGRTDWDQRVMEILSPQARYFHVDEVLRGPFYNTTERTDYSCAETCQITSIISQNTFKGLDVILQTANILKSYAGMNFSWNVLGIPNKSPLLKHFEKKLGLSARSLNIEFRPRASAAEICSLLSTTNVFVHPSHIENGSNALSEAQIMGCPVVAAHVGGLTTTIENGQTGMLVPSNDSWEYAASIQKIATDQQLAEKLGRTAQKAAKNRHEKKKIINSLFSAYNMIIG